MTHKSERQTGGITRRKALQTGAVVTGGLALGGTAIGTVGAKKQAEGGIVPEHHFVRAAEDSDPGSPKPDPQDLLVERREGHPVDDGTDEEELDGSHQLRWDEFSAVEGGVTMECNPDGSTDVSMRVNGLIPNGLYTVWVVVFEEPGFHFDSREIFPFGADGTAAENFVGAGPLGPQEGGENRFRARGSHGELSATHPTGELAIPSKEGKYTVEGCLLNEFEVHFVGDFHLDDQTHGPVPGGPGEHVEHVGAAFKGGESLF